MNLSDLTQAVTPTLDGPVLAVLAASVRPLTVGEVAAEAARGSDIGVRRSLARLVDQGIVRATIMGRNRVHELNREHLAAPIAERLATLRSELWRRFRETLATWDPPPLYAAIFGSAARGDGGPESDIDLLLISPPFPDAKSPLTSPKSLNALFPTAQPTKWREQVDQLRDSVQDWTGNYLQVLELSIDDWMQHRERKTPLLRDIQRDEILLVKHSGVKFLKERDLGRLR
ncbi:MAG: nucleotidyltransferase domain-containing protein [Candidatus Dormibacteraceae bacterium]